MPQMSPLMWMTLFLFFSAILLATQLKNYFNFSPAPDKKIKTLEKTTLSKNWMW